MLKLSARIEHRTKYETVIKVSLNGDRLGKLNVSNGNTDQLVGLLNAATELVELLAPLVSKTEITSHPCEVIVPIPRATWRALRALIAKAEGAT